MARRIKVGIDVGGTFTHAVAVDAATAEIVGTAMVPTSHAAAEGVARGVVDSMRRLLDGHGIAPGDVVFIAHSTTQATNALLEGDVAAVGIIGMGRGWERWRARGQTRIEGLELAPGKILRTVHGFLDTGTPLTEARIAEVIDRLRGAGAEVFVASEAFGVDDPANEHLVAAHVQRRGWLATAASDISQLYGLKVRTRTAVINASMMPRMLETADRTEQAVREAGITCPLMVMRSDGGIMDLAQMRRRPILTMLSGPAAGVSAALAFVKISDGLFLEVGGTSTDVSVVRNGRPSVRSAEIGGHRLYLRTLDIRTVGIGGGSMARLRDGHVVDVGPRSAHIAGLGYPSFVPVAADAAFSRASIAPRPGDPGDYVAIGTGGEGEPRFAYTVTDAANALGQVGGHAKATSDAAARVTAWLAAGCGVEADDFARRVLDRAAARVGTVVRAFVGDYGLDPKDVVLVGGGGGAEVVVPATGQATGLEVRLAERAEVISAIGVALGMIQDTVERTVVNPTEAELMSIRRAALESVLAMGAMAESVEVKVEVDTRQKRLVATARGTPELRTRSSEFAALAEVELRRAAAASCGVPLDVVDPAGRAGTLWVFRARQSVPRWFGWRTYERHPTRVVDHEGVVRLKLPDADTLAAPLSALAGQLSDAIDTRTVYGDAGGLLPDVFLAVAGRLVDLCGLATREQVLSLVRAECETLGGDEPAVAILASKRA